MLLPSGNPFKCHEEVLYFQLLIPPKRFDIFPPQTGGCSEGLGAFRFSLNRLDFYIIISFCENSASQLKELPHAPYKYDVILL